jgi:mRNA interferase YafQ
MLKIEYPSIFKKDYKRALKRGCNPKNFEKVVQMLQKQQPLPKKYHDHALTDSRNFGVRI